MNKLATFLLAGLLGSCAPSAADLDQTRGGQVEVYFNEPGTRIENMWEPDVIDVMIEMIDSATATIDFAVMGFGRDEVIDAFIRAHDRGVKVRMVGDAGHLYNSGYRRFIERQIPMQSGNLNHIMHNKFMVVDDRFVFAGTANWTDTDLRHNSNNFVVIDSPAVAADFDAEFEQMFAGKFGHDKEINDNERIYTVGDTTVEVWFSPQEDAMGRILEYVDAAQESVKFTIFAFTKDQVGSAFIRKQEELAAKGILEGDDPEWPRYGIAGMIDQSQLHSNGQYHEVYRLMGAGIPLRMDANDNSQQPGDYQAGGGRLHSKTMVIDPYGENPTVITGSFNWSASATRSNDEYLIVMRGARVAQAFDKYFYDLWRDGRRMGNERLNEQGITPGSIRIDEVMWYGAHENDPDGFDQYIELRNTLDRPVSLDLWQIGNVDDFVVGLPPGSTIPANGRFLILDHVLEPYTDGIPQDEVSAFCCGDMVVNVFNDNRQARLYLKQGAMELFLKDPAGQVVDVVGDGAPPYAGGFDDGTQAAFSMERLSDGEDGTLRESWQACSLSEGGINVNPPYRAVMIGTPGEPNSAP
ncbi:MAG: phospholipase D-like domain-containing protein [Myxococcota bacterium]